MYDCFFFFSSRRRHTRWNCDWSSDVCSSDLVPDAGEDALVHDPDLHGQARAAERLAERGGIDPLRERIRPERRHLRDLLEARARHDPQPAEEPEVREVEGGAVVEDEARAGEGRRRLRRSAAQPLSRHAEVGEDAERRAVLLERDEEVLPDPPALAEAGAGEGAGAGGRSGRAEDVPRRGSGLDRGDPPATGPRPEVPGGDLDLGKLGHDSPRDLAAPPAPRPERRRLGSIAACLHAAPPPPIAPGPREEQG